MLAKIFTAVLILAAMSCTKSGNEASANRFASDSPDTCDGPDSDIGCCFVNMPGKIEPVIRIADEDEKGERMIIKGRLMKDKDTPYSDVIIYAYHTDNGGEYSKKGNETGFQKWHGYLHGWGRTDDNGGYEIHSIKPGRYPSNNAPAHIHWAVKFPDGRMMYLNDFVFEGDPFVDEKYLSYLREPGDNGVVSLKENGNGILVGERVTVLGE